MTVLQIVALVLFVLGALVFLDGHVDLRAGRRERRSRR
jgi:hypothetical protein